MPATQRILVVEDDEGYQDLARLHLKGYDVFACASVEEALDAFQKKPFELIFCDINLLGMTGLELSGQLKARGLADGVPIVLCSSMADPQTRAAAIERGAAGFLVKPYEGDAMIALARALLHS
jgi:DNA-binding response OmpR family regulator